MAGEAGFRVRVVAGAGRPRCLVLEAGRTYQLGRDEASDLVLSGPGVSRRHARLVVDDSGVRFEDLGSAIGTRVGGRAVEGGRWSPGETLEIASASLQLEVVGVGAGPAPGGDGGDGADLDPGELLSALTALLVPGGEGDPPEALLGAMLDCLLRAFGADRAALLLPGGEAGERRPEALAVRPGSPLGERDPISRRVAERAASGPLLLDSLGLSELAAGIESLPGTLRSILAVPLPVAGSPGVLWLDSVMERRRFGEADLRLLQAFARAAAGVVERGRRLAAERERGERLAELVRGSPEGGGPVAGSAVMRTVLQALDRAAGTDVPVLLQGESGTGKEVLARTLHARSPRRDEPMVAVNCAALPPELFESELFGVEKGAFTGATERRRGRFELAHGGTLFLDEVAELPLAAQAKLLRVLEDRQVERLGGRAPVPVDFRLVAATNRDLEAEVAAGRFRADLRFRLAVFPVELPPLRDRGRDAVELARRFLEEAARRHGRPVRALSPEAERRILKHRWPGNVRELRNAVEAAVIREDGETLGEAALAPVLALSLSGPSGPPAASAATAAASGPGEPDPGASGTRWPGRLDEARQAFERAYLVARIREHQGNMKATAEAIGLARRHLYVRCEELGIDYRSFR